MACTKQILSSRLLKKLIKGTGSSYMDLKSAEQGSTLVNHQEGTQNIKRTLTELLMPPSIYNT